MKALIAAASIAWPLLLGAAAWQRAHDHSPAWTSGIYLIASTICHRLPARSFHTNGEQWPVCGRCSGLYLGAPFGAMLGLLIRRPRADANANIRFVIMAATPTIMTVALEWLGIYDVGNLVRLLAALPLGAAVALVMVGVVDRLATHG